MATDMVMVMAITVIAVEIHGWVGSSVFLDLYVFVSVWLIVASTPK